MEQNLGTTDFIHKETHPSFTQGESKLSTNPSGEIEKSTPHKEEKIELEDAEVATLSMPVVHAKNNIKLHSESNCRALVPLAKDTKSLLSEKCDNVDDERDSPPE